MLWNKEASEKSIRVSQHNSHSLTRAETFLLFVNVLELNGRIYVKTKSDLTKKEFHGSQII